MRRAAAGRVVVVVAAVVATLAGCGDAARDPAGGFAEVGSVGSSVLQVGDCLNIPAPGSTETGDMVAVPCGTPHEAVVYHQFQAPDGDGSFPGRDALEAASDEGCRARFADFVGVAYEESALEYATIFPLEDTWADGLRTVSCLVVFPHGGIVGSLEGSGVTPTP
jgi:hypothetical protein